MGELAAYWSTDDYYDVYLWTDELTGKKQRVYVDLTTNEVNYITFDDGYIGYIMNGIHENDYDDPDDEERYFDMDCDATV